MGGRETREMAIDAATEKPGQSTGGPSLGEAPDSLEARRDPSSPPPSGPKLKSEAVAIVLAAAFPGLGHIYAERYSRGMIILAVAAAILTAYFLIVLQAGWFIFAPVIAVFAWLWQIYDAYRSVKAYNQNVTETGAKPL